MHGHSGVVHGAWVPDTVVHGGVVHGWVHDRLLHDRLLHDRLLQMGGRLLPGRLLHNRHRINDLGGLSARMRGRHKSDPCQMMALRKLVGIYVCQMQGLISVFSMSLQHARKWLGLVHFIACTRVAISTVSDELTEAVEVNHCFA